MPKTQAPTSSLTIDVRTHSGTTSARAVRRAGNIPGVLYGHGEPTAISLGAKALETLLTHGGKSQIVNAVIGGKPDSVLLREVQRDPLTHRPIHADFQRVTQSEAITATVAIVVGGSSAAVRDGAILDIVVRSVDVKGPAGQIPENIAIDVTDLGVAPQLGTPVVLWGAGLPVERIAALAGTIPYELLCGISQRVAVDICDGASSAAAGGLSSRRIPF